MADRVMTDAEHAAERDAGMYVCRCLIPEPTPIGLFATVQCKRCFKPLPRHTHQSGSPI